MARNGLATRLYAGEEPLRAAATGRTHAMRAAPNRQQERLVVPQAAGPLTALGDGANAAIRGLVTHPAILPRGRAWPTPEGL